MPKTAKAESLPTKVAARPMRKTGLALEVRPQGMRKAWMVEANIKNSSSGEITDMAEPEKIMMRKLMEPAVRLRS